MSERFLMDFCQVMYESDYSENKRKELIKLKNIEFDWLENRNRLEQFHKFEKTTKTNRTLPPSKINSNTAQLPKRKCGWLFFTSIMSDKNHNQKRLLQCTVQQSINPKKPKHWSLSLLDSMKDPDSIVKSSEKIVVIRDKYPKAKVHYLVLPHEEISSIYKLDRSHVSLLEEFGHMFKKIQEKEDYNLTAGFHAVPSMQRLHMHIISTDMISPCLKTKIHWNSFTTEFFKPYNDVLRELKENGLIQKMLSETHKKLMSTELQCNQCSYKPKNMPQLKEHLLSHSK